MTPSLAYTLTANPGTSHGAGWSTATATAMATSSSTPVTAQVALNEQGGTLNITVKQKTGGSAVDGATVSVDPVDTAVTPPTDDVTNNKGLVNFAELPPGDYDLTASKTTKPTGPDGSTVSTTQMGTVHVTVGTTAQAVTITIATVP